MARGVRAAGMTSGRRGGMPVAADSTLAHFLGVFTSSALTVSAPRPWLYSMSGASCVWACEVLTLTASAGL